MQDGLKAAMTSSKSPVHTATSNGNGAINISSPRVGSASSTVIEEGQSGDDRSSKGVRLEAHTHVHGVESEKPLVAGKDDIDGRQGKVIKECATEKASHLVTKDDITALFDANLPAPTRKSDPMARGKVSDSEVCDDKQAARIRRQQEKKREKQQRELKREQEKQEREARRLEEKNRKDEEKRERARKKEEERKQKELKREEEKRQREMKREVEKQRKEDQRLRREEEKKAKEEEKLRKEEDREKAQARIGNFFKKAKPSKTAIVTKSDFEKSFLPFYLRNGVRFANDKILTPEKLLVSKSSIDSQLIQNFENKTERWLMSTPRLVANSITMTATNLMQQMTSKEKSEDDFQKLLQQIPQKYIKFYENVRPPYIGTYSKEIILPKDNPLSTAETGYDYDYDSDWDWNNEGDEEGGGIEDLDDAEVEEEEDDAEDGSEGEFDEFLEDADTIDGAKKQKFVGPLIPTVKLRTDYCSLPDDDRYYFDLVSVEALIIQQPFPISIDYNPPSKRPANDENKVDARDEPSHKNAKSVITESADLITLYNEVHESSFSLATLTELAQNKLPKYSKKTIRNTIKDLATRVAVDGKASKIWQLNDKEKWENLKIGKSLPES
ncbi:LAMI_0H13366g1_1 [Lachancea mirantina]|uniref:LAMI_0H13366g1_1 n=1 Tax=Lachancea mirantina TaxID=1230905 RepID=A0A1G4KHY7_9SACH|nr:LAMI_0H13366g1_1 [Lachancea mirantina]